MSETPTSEREAKVRLPSQARVLWLGGLLGVSLLVGYLSSHLQRGAIWSVPLPNVDQVLIAAAHEDLDEIVLVTSSSSRSPKGSRITTYSLGTGAVRSVWEDSRVFPTLQSRATADRKSTRLNSSHRH